jgi:hypothetical protein
MRVKYKRGQPFVPEWKPITYSICNCGNVVSGGWQYWIPTDKDTTVTVCKQCFDDCPAPEGDWFTEPKDDAKVLAAIVEYEKKRNHCRWPTNVKIPRSCATQLGQKLLGKLWDNQNRRK